MKKLLTWIGRHCCLFVATFLVLLVVVGPVFGRVGGGQSYSGGGSGGGGGGGGGDDLVSGLIELLVYVVIQLNVDYPVIGIPIDLVILTVIVLVAYAKWTGPSRVAGFSSQTYKPSTPTATVADPKQPVKDLREHDPNFSPILFTDFTYALYAAVQEARGRKELANYTPYLQANVIQKLEQLGPPDLKRVSGVIVAASRIIRQSERGNAYTLVMQFETNYTETTGSQHPAAWYCREQWTFTRDADVLSRPPDKVSALHCPKCGGGLEQTPDGACKHCGVKITGGNFDWYVTDVSVLERSNRGPTLTTTQPEVGADWPTVYQRDFEKHRQQFLALNPDFHWERLAARIQHIFIELQGAWSDLKWERARPFVSDSLFQMLNYWISEYQRQHLRNVLDSVRIDKIDPVKVTLDAFHDALTFRIFASMVDYTIDDKGAVVCGDKSSTRRFSEYWTFIRRRGVKETEKGNENCPNCGASLKINMAGVCAYCNGKVTSGVFDWVLSRIEQDEAYRG